MRELSALAARIPKSPTIAMDDKAKQMIAAGENVIALAGGEPDFDTPGHVIEAGIQSILAGKTRYAAPAKGITPLLQAIANKMARDNNIHLYPDTDIIVTPGGKWALYLTVQALLNPGDEVLIPMPAWVSYVAMVTMVGGTPVPVHLDASDNFTITAEKLRAHLTPRTKVIMINTPNNPNGRVLTMDEAQAIVDVALEADLYVVADEIYEKIIFDGRRHITIGALPGMAERTITINGMSKSYAMTGWRLGWLAGPTPIMAVASKFNTQTVTSAATFTMHAAVAALNGPQDSVHVMCEAYCKRRDFITKALNEIDGIECLPVEGAFYAFPRFPHSKKTSLELAEALLDKVKIAGVPGSAFGQPGEGHVRFSFAAAMSSLEEAVERIAKIAPDL